jgi:hypothetical protein
MYPNFEWTERRSRRMTSCGWMVLGLILLFWGQAWAKPQDPLPSWNTGTTKAQIEGFVRATTTKGSPQYVRPEDRIAVFDNDGTLWSEQPAYFELMFAMDQIKAQSPQHPEWQTTEPYQSAMNDDLAGVMASGESGLSKILVASHSGMTTEAFTRAVNEWAATHHHPVTGRVYTEMVYQPMLELLHYLRANGYKTFIVSGGGQDFMRAWTYATYGIPTEQVIGSQGELTWQESGADGKPFLMKGPKPTLVDDGSGKPVGIERGIGRKPTLAFGNSDGDLQMLEWTTSGDGPRFAGLVHHTDGAREVAYDRDSKIGKLDKALDEAPQRGWVVVDMQRDWRVIYPPEPAH